MLMPERDASDGRHKYMAQHLSGERTFMWQLSMASGTLCQAAWHTHHPVALLINMMGVHPATPSQLSLLELLIQPAAGSLLCLNCPSERMWQSLWEAKRRGTDKVDLVSVSRDPGCKPAFLCCFHSAHKAEESTDKWRLPRHAQYTSYGQIRLNGMNIIESLLPPQITQPNVLIDLSTCCKHIFSWTSIHWCGKFKWIHMMKK